MKDPRMNIMRDLALIILSIVIAVILAKTGALAGILTSTQEWKFFGSFVAGIFFVSMFTAAPASVVLFEISAANSILLVAFFGAVGALLGDLLIFRFVKDSLAQDMRALVTRSGRRRIGAIFQLRLFRWLVPFLGALIVASPFPDEVGLVLMGLSKMKTSAFIPISFALNFLGILVIGLFARHIF